MKRLTVLLLILAGFIALCFGQGTPRRFSTRVSPRKVIQLTDPVLAGQISFEQALSKRRSASQFTNQQLRLVQIGQLAWAGQGIIEPQSGLRTAPSTEATYPIELFFSTPEGLFIYKPQEHSLEQMSDQDIRTNLAAAASMDEAIVSAPCNIIITGSIRKFNTQLRNDARKFMLLEAGRISQNIQLQAVCMDMGSNETAAFDVRSVSKICKLQRELEPIYIISVGYPAIQAALGIETGQSAGARRAVFIVASQNFQDEELFETMRVFGAAGVQTFIASTRTGIIRGVLGNTAEASVLVNQLRVDDYDVIIFVGGPGAAVEYFANPAAWNIAREATVKRKILAAIGIAPTILSNAGVLNGIRATSYLSERERLVQTGAIYTGAPIERSGLIITSTGPQSAVQFGQTIADTLEGR